MPGVKTNEREGTRAVLRHHRMSASKVRQVLNLIRDKDVTTAAEILANIVEHGRRDGRPVNVEVEISVGGGRLQIGLTDDGDEPDVDINGAAMPGWDAERGRGLAMAKSLLDGLTYWREGAENRWTLVSEPF